MQTQSIGANWNNNKKLLYHIFQIIVFSRNILKHIYWSEVEFPFDLWVESSEWVPYVLKIKAKFENFYTFNDFSLYVWDANFRTFELVKEKHLLLLPLMLLLLLMLYHFMLWQFTILFSIIMISNQQWCSLTLNEC